jgi:3-oxoacyl-[acyl-carrier protein] reductase
MSKAAMISLTKNLSVQYAGKINVNDVAPSWVDTPMNEGLSKAFMEESLQKFSIQRQADPMEIANVIFFLASDEASFINGEVIVVDGGRK